MMLNYTGANCPVCGKTFGEDDDIVVCPDCGAPYHRECYRQVGECIFGDLHREGKEWQPPVQVRQAQAQEATARVKEKECPICGTLNDREARFCDRCGALLDDPEDEAQENAPPFQPMPGQFRGMPFPFDDPMGGVDPTEKLTQEIDYGEVSKVVRVNTMYYMPVFRYIRMSGRNKFNFCAFLFSGAWMLYRKQYKHGAVITLLMFALLVLFQCSYALISYPTMLSVAQQAGLDLSQSLYLGSEQYDLLAAQMMVTPGAMLRISGCLIFPALMLLVMIVVGLRGNRMYMNHCVETVRSIRREEEDVQVALEKRGGVNSTVTALVAMGYFLVRTVLPMLLM